MRWASVTSWPYIWEDLMNLKMFQKYFLHFEFNMVDFKQVVWNHSHNRKCKKEMQEKKIEEIDLHWLAIIIMSICFSASSSASLPSNGTPYLVDMTIPPPWQLPDDGNADEGDGEVLTRLPWELGDDDSGDGDAFTLLLGEHDRGDSCPCNGGVWIRNGDLVTRAWLPKRPLRCVPSAATMMQLSTGRSGLARWEVKHESNNGWDVDRETTILLSSGDVDEDGCRRREFGAFGLERCNCDADWDDGNPGWFKLEAKLELLLLPRTVHVNPVRYPVPGRSGFFLVFIPLSCDVILLLLALSGLLLLRIFCCCCCCCCPAKLRKNASMPTGLERNRCCWRRGADASVRFRAFPELGLVVGIGGVDVAPSEVFVNEEQLNEGPAWLTRCRVAGGGRVRALEGLQQKE